MVGVPTDEFHVSNYIILDGQFVIVSILSLFLFTIFFSQLPLTIIANGESYLYSVFLVAVALFLQGTKHKVQWYTKSYIHLVIQLQCSSRTYTKKKNMLVDFKGQLNLSYCLKLLQVIFRKLIRSALMTHFLKTR